MESWELLWKYLRASNIILGKLIENHSHIIKEVVTEEGLLEDCVEFMVYMDDKCEMAHLMDCLNKEG